jgi:lipoteichoic acid synthase
MHPERSPSFRPGPFAIERLRLLITITFLCTLWGLAALRTGLIDRRLGAAIGCEGCLTADVLLHDAMFLGFISTLALLGLYAKTALLASPLRLIAIVAMAIYALDMFVFAQFFTRLHIGDILVYGAQPGVVLQHVYTTGILDLPMLVAAGACIIAVGFFLLLPAAHARPRPFVVSVLVLPLFLAVVSNTTASPRSYVHDWAVRNVVVSNLVGGVSVPYSESVEAVDLAEQAQPLRCIAGASHEGSIVVLILESWSPYQSRIFGGMFDWTPQLDRFAARNAYFSRMYASGFTTNEGLMSLLAGVEVLSPVKGFFRVTPFETAWSIERSIARLVRERGMHSAFLTSGNLAFSRKGQWLANAGFDYVEGHDHPFYEGMPRRHFGAAPDDALYQRALEYLRGLGDDVSVLLVIESVSSHHPYIHPYTGDRVQESVFRYMDEAAAEFLGALEGSGFLEQGHVFVVSDHRAMIPLSPKEAQSFGRGAASLVPAIWAGPKAPTGRIDHVVHQADLVDTVDWLISEESCSNRNRASMLDPSAFIGSRRCVFHARGDNRDHIDVFCPDGGEGTIRLGGDATRFVDSHTLDDTRRDEIVRWLKYYRLTMDRHHEATRAQGH